MPYAIITLPITNPTRDVSINNKFINTKPNN